MKLKSVSIDGVKNVRGKIQLQTNNLLLIGPAGRGKSTVLDSIALTLRLKTSFGKQGLGRLSPSENWSTSLQFDDQDSPVRGLALECKRGRMNYELNGSKVNEKDYTDAVKQILDVEDHHVSLDEFIGLSGEKRAGVFAGLLAGQTEVGLDDVLEPSLKDWLTAHAAGSHFLNERFARYLDRLMVMKALPNDLVDDVKKVVNDLAGATKDARAHLEQLINSQTDASHGMTPAELKQKIAEADEKIGEIKARKDNMEIEKSRYDSSRSVLQRVDQNIEGLREQIAAAEEAGKEIPSVEEEMESQTEKLKELEEREAELQKALEQMSAKKQELEHQLSRLKDGRALVDGLLKRDWRVADDWLHEEAEQFISDLIASDFEIEWTGKARTRTLDFVKEVITEALGGSLEKFDDRIAEASQQLDAIKHALITPTQQRNNTATEIGSLRNTITNLGKQLERARDKASSLGELQTDLEKQLEEKRTLESGAGATATTSDPAIIDHELNLAKSERNRLNDQLTELEEAKAISGQIEAQRATVALHDQAVGVVKDLAKAVQAWRDKRFAEQVQTIIQPFSERFKMLFPDSVLEIDASGSGRATKFEFTVRKTPTGPAIPIDLLSGSETVLAAAAFLSALQHIKQGPGTILLMNTEALDATGLQTALKKFPQLGFDFIGLADNHAKDAGELWQVVDMAANQK